MTSEYVQIHPQALTDYIAAIACAAGSHDVEAQRVACNLVLANLSGHDSHGVGMMPWYVKYIKSGALALNRGAQVTGDMGAMLMVDGHKGYGQVIGHEAMQLGIERARQQGMALVALRNSHHLGRIGQWAEDCAAAGMVSIHFVNALLWPLVAPYAGSDARFATNALRVQNRAVLAFAIANLLRTRRTAEWVALLESQAVPCGPVNDIAQAFNEAQVQARELVVRQACSPFAQAAGAPSHIASVASPLRLRANPPVLRRAPPALGEHTDEVLAELGFDQSAIAALRAAAVV